MKKTFSTSRPNSELLRALTHSIKSTAGKIVKVELIPEGITFDSPDVLGKPWENIWKINVIVEVSEEEGKSCKVFCPYFGEGGTFLKEVKEEPPALAHYPTPIIQGISFKEVLLEHDNEPPAISGHKA